MHRMRGTLGDPFEYRDLVIPLSLRLEGSRPPTRRELAMFHGVGGVVVHQLGLAVGEGWEADEAADWDSLAMAGRFEREVESGSGGETVTVYKSVTIRLKRLVRPGETRATERTP